MQAIEMSQTKDVTIYDIAEVLNVSPATVSRGLKDHPGLRKDTKKRILETARKMGYQHNTFASNLRRKRTNTIGVIIPRLNSYFMSTVIAGMEKVANENGYNLIIAQSQELFKKEIAAVNTMFNSRVDGLMISLSYDTRNSEHFSVLMKKQIPLIFFDRVTDIPNCTNIVIDNTRAGYDATVHLLDQGCKRIAHVGGSLTRNVYADRLKGQQQAMAERGIKLEPDLIINNNLSEQEGAQAVQQLLKLNKTPDGIFAANDSSAVGIIRELKQAGLRVPDDIAVVGFNNDPISRVIDPNLTTVNYPGEEMGEVAANTMINKLKDGPTANLNTIVLRHELIIRDSSRRKK